jgi:hypothetical protein
MLPSHVVFMDALPLTPNKKVDRKALPRPEQHAAPAEQPAAPASEIEARIQSIWCEVLGVRQVGLLDNFFDIGGHSLLAVKAHRRLKESFARDLAITDLFRFPTVRALGAYLQGPDAAASGADTGRQRGEARRELLARRRGAPDAARGKDDHGA